MAEEVSFSHMRSSSSIRTFAAAVATGAAVCLMAAPGIARAQNLFVAGEDSGSIEEFSPTGADLGAFASGINGPLGIAVNAGGDVFVSAGGNGDIDEFAPSGTSLGVFASGLDEPWGPAIHAAGDVFADGYASGIEEFSPTGADLGNISTTLGYAALTVSPTQFLFAAQQGTGTIERFSPTGTDLGSFAVSAGAPVALAFGPASAPEPGSFSLVAFGSLTAMAMALGRRRRGQSLHA
jgi:hypothetical protein